MNILWLQSAGCEGCTMSLLCAEVCCLLNAIEAGEQKLDILCIEGSIVRGPRGSGKCQVMAAARALADAAGVQPAPEGANVAALLPAVENVSDHLTHFN